MSKYKIPLLILVIILALALTKILFLTEKSPEAKGPMASGAGQPSLVTGYEIKYQPLTNEIFSSGTIIANEEAELRPEVSGKITQLNIVEGGNVAKGELLMKINDADLQAQLKKLQLQLTLAEEKEVRSKKILDINGISREEYDISLNTVNTLKADIANLNAQIAKTEIRAPFNGVLGIRKVSEGSYISPTMIIASIQQVDPIKIDFYVPEKYMSKLKRGDNISFTVQGLDEIFKAKIYAIDPKIEASTRSIQIRAIASNSNRKIFPGAFAKVQLSLSKNEKALMIPTEAVIPVLKGQKIFLYKNGKAQEQLVEIGVRSSSSVEIVKGVSVGDTVVVTGIMTIRQDAPLKLSKVE